MAHDVIYFPSEKCFSDGGLVCRIDPSEPSERIFVYRSQIASIGHICLIHLDIFYSLATTPKSIHCKHPDRFRKLNKHLIVEMCENTYIGVWSFSGISSRIQPLAHTPCCSSWSFYPKTVEITYPK